MTYSDLKLNRRGLLSGVAGTLAASQIGGVSAAAQVLAGPLSVTTPYAPPAGPRSRVIFVNDLSGDPDGVFAAVHQILTPTAELCGIVGTDAGGKGETAALSTKIAREIVRLMDRQDRIPVFEGAANRMGEARTPVRSAGTQAIIDEAMRTDTKLPLYVAVGGGLTEVASAVLIEPRIIGRFTLVWIGGDALPGGGTGETNFNIDRLAAQFLYNETQVPIWQLPRAVYKTCLVSATEIQAFVAPHGRIGAWLYDRLGDLHRRFQGRLNTGETWTLGDSPLVLLTGMHDWVPGRAGGQLSYTNTGSSLYDEVVAPRLNPDGTFTARTEGRNIRVYRSIDTRMLFSDFFAKMRINYPAR